MVNNSTKQPLASNLSTYTKKKDHNYGVGNPGPGLGQTQKSCVDNKTFLCSNRVL